MNINDFKHAYDGIQAGKSLKKRVTDSARLMDAKVRKKETRREKPRGMFRSVMIGLGSLAGAAAVITLTIAGGGFLSQMIKEKQSIVVTAPEKPVLSESAVFSPASARESVGELQSPKLSADPAVYETMPPLTDDEKTDDTFCHAFQQRFLAYSFDTELIQAVGEEAFEEWLEKFLPSTSGVCGKTFYNQPTLLAYVTYFEISPEKAEKLLSSCQPESGGFSEDEIRAVASRDEELCYRFFVNEIPLITNGSEGYVFYTLEDLYEMPPRELAELLKEANDMTAETLQSLQNWAEMTGDPLYTAAVRRKILLVSSYLYEKGQPELPDNRELTEIYVQKVSDFSETLEIDGCEIFNYVRRLAEQSAPDEETLRILLNGSVGDSISVLPSYHRLLSVPEANISPEKLLEALKMINQHYYAQKGEKLYSDKELDLIVYGTDEEFTQAFLNPAVFRSENNALGIVHLTPAELYETAAADWLEYRDLPEEKLWEIRDLLSGSQQEFFQWKLSCFLEIRTLTALYLDGGALAADEELLGVAPTLSEELQTKLQNKSFTLTTDGTHEPLMLSGASLYYASLSNLAEWGVSGVSLDSAVREMIESVPIGYDQYSIRLLMTSYLYRWHTGSVNLYCDEYLGLLLNPTNYSFRTDGKKVLLQYPVAEGIEGMRKILEKYHITEFASSEEELELPKNGDPAKTELQVFETASADEAALEEVAAMEEDFVDFSPDLLLQTDVNRILPESGDRGLFFCAYFGYDKWLESDHKGLDFPAREGDPIAAYDSGTVAETGSTANYGNYIIIDHGNDKQTLYAHCGTLLFKEGDEVRLGDIIAGVDDTGYCYGPHLHFEVIRNGESVDPVSYLEK